MGYHFRGDYQNPKPITSGKKKKNNNKTKKKRKREKNLDEIVFRFMLQLHKLLPCNSFNFHLLQAVLTSNFST